MTSKREWQHAIQPLGKTDLRVSRLCLGCMTFGEPIAVITSGHCRKKAPPIIKRALEGGINFFDTANSYSDGSSEGIVGRACGISPVVKRRRATKCSIALVIYPKDIPCTNFALYRRRCAVSAWIMTISCRSIAGITTRQSKRRWKP
ncbi:aldo/keto reductase [Escherichia coli]